LGKDHERALAALRGELAHFEERNNEIYAIGRLLAEYLAKATGSSR
jgi:hypothetical protein